MNKNTILTKELAEALTDYVIDEVNEEIIIGFWNDLTTDGNLELYTDFYDLCEIVQSWFGLDGLIDALLNVNNGDLNGNYHNYDEWKGFRSFDSLRDFSEFDKDALTEAIKGLTIEEAINKINALSGRKELKTEDITEAFKDWQENN